MLSACQLATQPPFYGVVRICMWKEIPWRIFILMYGFHEHLMYGTSTSLYFHEISSLTIYLFMAVSITMATSLHHYLKLNGATPRTGTPLFWPFLLSGRFVYRVREGWEGGWNILQTKNAWLPPTALMIPVRKTRQPAKSSSIGLGVKADRNLSYCHCYSPIDFVMYSPYWSELRLCFKLELWYRWCCICSLGKVIERRSKLFVHNCFIVCLGPQSGAIGEFISEKRNENLFTIV